MTKKHFEWAARELAKRYYTDDQAVLIGNFCACMFGQFSDKFDAGRFHDKIEELRHG